MNLFWIYGFNVLINSVLAFLTVALLVKFLLWVFKIQQPRIQALALSLPLFKVGFDLFFYDFSRWALSHQINPILSEPGTRAIQLTCSFPTSTASFIPLNTGIHFTVANGKTFTVADIVALSIDPVWIQLSVILAVIGSLGFCSLRLRQSFRSRKTVNKIIQNSLPCWQPLSASLQAALKKTQLLISTEVDVPCAAGRSILFPEKLLDKLTRAEFEAIVVHELDHLRWKDSYLRAAQRFLSAFFWWIPTKRWQSRLELAQELACDAKISKFHLSPIDLVSAITKAARAAKTSSPCLPLMCFVEKGRLLGRMKALVKPAKRRSIGFRVAQTLLVSTFLTMIFFGQFWIF